ncbi:tetratricopeptide repeat protein [Empedobacter falsenii]
MRKIKLYSGIVIYFFITSICYAQNEINQKLYGIELLFVDEKFDQAEKELLKAEKLYGNDDLNKVKIFARFSMLYLLENKIEKAYNYAESSKEIAAYTSDKLDDAYNLESFARIYLNNQLPEKTVEFANEALKILDKYPKEYFLKSRIYSLLTMMHTRNGVYSVEYENYMNEALKNALLSKNPLQIYNSLTEKSLVSYAKYNQTHKQEDIENAIKYTEEALHFVEENTKTLYASTPRILLYNNYSSLLFNYPNKKFSTAQRLKLAEEYTLKGLKLSEQSNIKGMQMATYASYAQILETKNLTKQAEDYYIKAYNLAKDDKINRELRVAANISDIVARFYEKEGQLEKSLFYTQENLRFTKESFKQLTENKRKFLEIYFSTEQKNQQIKQLEEKNQIYSKQKFLYIGITLLAIAGLIFLMYMLYYKLKSNKQKTDLLEAERYEAELNLELEKEEKARIKAEQELLALQQEQLNKQALATSLQLKQKNSFLNELKEKIKDKEALNLDRILKDERLMDDDFNEIQNIIKEVHPNFFNKLSEVSKSKLTNQDMKYAAYLYLNMDNVQIANVMKVETKTVRMAKYRLKQKIGLEKEADLQIFIQSLFS